MVQLLVLSSGGFRSPFLILIHIYTLGTSFLIGLTASIFFLVSTVLGLTFQIYFDENIKKLFFEDLGTILLYGASFLVIVPILILLSRLYILKDKLLEIFRRELNIQKIQNQALLKGTSDMIFVTDADLNIISVNEAAETELSLPESGILQRPLFDILFLRDETGKLASAKNLSIDRVIEEKSTRIIQGFHLLTKNRGLPRLVGVQIRPILSLDGKVDQVMVIVGGDTHPKESLHTILEDARLRHSTMSKELRKLLIIQGLTQLSLRSDLIWKTSQDILLLDELEDHPVQPVQTLSDVAQLCSKHVSNLQDFAKSLGVSLEFHFINFDSKDIESLIPKGFKISPQLLTAPYFTCPIDIKWFDILIDELLNMVILLMAGSQNPKIMFTIETGREWNLIKIITGFTLLKEGDQTLLFRPYYADLSNRTNLRLGSGLEGLLAKKISDSLNIPLNAELTNGQIILTLRLNRVPQTS